MQTLDRLYPNPPIPLSHKSPFQLLVAVILSGRSTDKTVNRVTPALFALAATPEKMAKLSVSRIQSIIRPCGLSPAKAKAISQISKILIREYESQVPASFKALEALPHVGHKTASVVMAQAFEVPAFPVDTHIHRLAKRWGLSSGKNVKQTEQDLKRLFSKNQWIKLHLQMIYYGREYCPALRHNEERCELCHRFTT